MVDTAMQSIIGGSSPVDIFPTLIIYGVGFFLFYLLITMAWKIWDSRNDEEETTKKSYRGAKMETKTYTCSECKEEYETQQEATDCCGTTTDEEQPEESLIMIDGELRRGHFECQDSECNWTGSEEETKSINMANMKKFTLPNGDLIYTGDIMEDKETPDLVIRVCPECDSAKIKFVPEPVATSKKDVSI